MTPKQCPMCGEATLHEKHGEYRMELPPNLSEGHVVISNAAWLHCNSCGEGILSEDLEKAINSRCHEMRVSKAV